MRALRVASYGVLALAVVGVTFIGCSSREARLASTSASQIQWHGRIYPVVGEAGERAEENSLANATMTLLPDRGVRATVTLRGGLTAGEYPWHVHVGECGSGGAILGNPDEYPSLVPGQDGMGNETATFDASLDPDAAYYVNIHRSEEEIWTIVACGELVRG